jgi:hypothetical protein
LQTENEIPQRLTNHNSWGPIKMSTQISVKISVIDQTFKIHLQLISKGWH